MESINYSQTNMGVYTYVNACGNVPRPRFWRGQFGDAPTRAQVRFDVIFGLVLPVLCFAFDPIVFRGDTELVGGDGVYRQVRLFAYTASAIEMATLACWLFVIRRHPAWSRPAGGVMAAGALFSFALGVAILPFSVLGMLFVGVGALGFIPFVTALVYLRNARRALRLNRAGSPVRGGASAAFAFGLAFALGTPAAAQRGATLIIRGASAEVLAGGRLSPQRRRVVRALALLSGETFYDLVEEHGWQPDAERRFRLAEAYRQVTGGDITDYRYEHRHSPFDD
ncbi:MAG TPA: hypothetical protein VM936_17220 [Pyrinomonadaceae bacterium]|nr:hypothetical protein [Pyrinomonadaceae bacterium]